MTEQNDAVLAELPAVGVLLADAWGLFRRRFWFLLMAGGLGGALTLAGAFAPFLAALALAVSVGAGGATWILAGLASLSAALWLGSWAQVAVTEAALNPWSEKGVAELYRDTWGRIAGFTWVCLLAFVFAAGGLFLFILPGVFLAAALVFAPYVYLAEGLRGMDALAGSLGHVRGRWPAVFGRLALVGLGSFLASYIPLIGPFTGIVTGPFSLIYSALLYRSLKNLPSQSPLPPGKAKLLIASAALGFVLPIWGTIRMIPVLRDNLPLLREQARYLAEHPGDSQAAEKLLRLLEGPVSGTEP